MCSAEKLESPEAEQSNILPVCFSSHSLNTCSFHSNLLPCFSLSCDFFGGNFVFKMASKSSSAKVLSSVLSTRRL